MKTKILLGAAVILGLLGSQAPDANADFNTSFMECLTQEGMTIINPAEATRYAALIQQDELNNVPIGVTARALVKVGFDPLKAGIYIACVTRAKMGITTAQVASQDTSVDDLFGDEDYNLSSPLTPAPGPTTVTTPGTSGVGVIV